MEKAAFRHAVAALMLAALCGTSTACAAFGFDDVVQQASELAGKAYEAPAAVPKPFSTMDYDEHSQIRFQPDHALWSDNDSRFRVVLSSPGRFFDHAVQINLVDGGKVRTLPFHKEWFSWPDSVKGKVPDDLGYAGFKLTYPINAPNKHDQILSFLGASYFRVIGRHQVFGLSGRGIAIDTGLPGGEEFPDFTRFWLVRPAPDANVMHVYALLDGPSLTGAYQFVIYPGLPTRIDVHAKLFVRKDIKLLGIAPLTSMFFYGENTTRPAGHWRPESHDSDGLLIHSSDGEWLWRPLLNPKRLQLDYFAVNSPRGFGLLQRDTTFSHYEDAEFKYEKRPSAWVQPHGDWGKGHVVLLQLPTDADTNDNIGAFWSPEKEPKAGDTYDLSYTLLFGKPSVASDPMAKVVATRVVPQTIESKGKKADAYRFIVDFKGGPLDTVQPDNHVLAVVTGVDASRIDSQQVRYIPQAKLWRLSLLVRPPEDKPLELRAFLKLGQQTLSGTWNYKLASDNRFEHGK